MVTHQEIEAQKMNTLRLKFLRHHGLIAAMTSRGLVTAFIA
jgi:hypothetical protein